MKIGKINLPTGAALAPMAGVADRAFRELCVRFGAVYVVGEMVSAKGMTMGDRKSDALLALSKEEHPAAVQLFGKDPAVLAQAAVQSLRYQPDVIDINMGCPAPKVANNGGGATLMRNPALAGEIVAAVSRAVEVPVTVKIRAGWDSDTLNAVEMATICEAAGAAAVTVHGRTRAQMYAPPVDLDIIRQVKAAVHIPVIGNGDVTDGESAKAMLETTGCDMVMVGRGALGRPWVFDQIRAYLTSGEILPDPPVDRRMTVMLEHIERLCAYKGDYIGMREARKHAAWYMKGLHGAAAYRNEICTLNSFDDLRRLADRVIREQA